MIPSYWYSAPIAYLWQVTLHSAVAAVAFAAWARHLRARAGRSKRWMLWAILALPLFTAAVPGRYGPDFRERWAWFDSARILALPLLGGYAVYHLVLALAALSAGAGLVQEIAPALFPKSERSGAGEPAPERLLRRVRRLPGWEDCRVGVVAGNDLWVAAAGPPGKPRLLISKALLRALDDRELEAVLRHERAHHRRHRWFLTHLAFALRILQLHNPVALWAFREYSVEVEIDCDAEAVAGTEPDPLASALVKIYERTSSRDVAARTTLKKRVDILLGRVPREDDNPRPEAVLLASALLLALLPWLA